jgi:hypothetical protein
VLRLPRGHYLGTCQPARCVVDPEFTHNMPTMTIASFSFGPVSGHRFLLRRIPRAYKIVVVKGGIATSPPRHLAASPPRQRRMCAHFPPPLISAHISSRRHLLPDAFVRTFLASPLRVCTFGLCKYRNSRQTRHLVRTFLPPSSALYSASSYVPTDRLPTSARHRARQLGCGCILGLLFRILHSLTLHTQRSRPG